MVMGMNIAILYWSTHEQVRLVNSIALMILKFSHANFHFLRPSAERNAVFVPASSTWATLAFSILCFKLWPRVDLFYRGFVTTPMGLTGTSGNLSTFLPQMVINPAVRLWQSLTLQISQDFGKLPS